jgi:DNA-binding NtrC family response regulator
MLRRLLVIGSVTIGFVTVSADLSACGDKFLRAGRSSRIRNYAAVHPASILIYKPVNATTSGLKDWQKTLKQAGHTSHVVDHGTALTQAFAGAEYDLVIADYADASKVKAAAQALPSQPRVLPILHKPTKTLAEEAKKEYEHLINPDKMDKFQALAEIDHVMEMRLKESKVASSR